MIASLTLTTGDLLDPAHGFDAIGHGVNLHGVMGAGIAKTISGRWPGILPSYQEACRTDELGLGGAHIWVDEASGLVIYNLATQDRPGPNASLRAVRSAIEVMVEDAEENNIRHIGLPQIGCGIGGLDWDDVLHVIGEAIENRDVDITAVIYDRNPS